MKIIEYRNLECAPYRSRFVLQVGDFYLAARHSRNGPPLQVVSHPMGAQQFVTIEKAAAVAREFLAMGWDLSVNYS